MPSVAQQTGLAIEWSVDHGVWFRNGLMTIELAGRRAGLSVDQAIVDDRGQALDRALQVQLSP